MNYGNIDATPEALRHCAETAQEYARAQYELMVEYLKALQSLESDNETDTYQSILGDILQMCKQAEDLYQHSYRISAVLLEKARILEHAALQATTAALLQEVANGRSSADVLHPNRYAITLQSVVTRRNADGRIVTVFDHPEESVRNAVYAQGSCTVDGKSYQGTCGICALTTLLRKAGIYVDEQAALPFAVKKKLCDTTSDKANYRGGTCPGRRTQLASLFSLQMETMVEKPLQELAELVESGYGVIIAVMSSDGYYNPNGWYTGSKGGHAIVLNSVERDAVTGEILAYHIIDSNGPDSDSAGIWVPADILLNAYAARGSVANVTTNIIW